MEFPGCAMRRSLRRRVVITAFLLSFIITMTTILLIVLLLGQSAAAPVMTGRRGYTKDEYLLARQRLLATDESRALGAGLQLTEKEKLIDNMLLQEKSHMMEKARLDRQEYIPAVSFARSKQWLEQTNTFKIIRKMPKGAALHLHEPAITSLRWLVANVTYRQDVYMRKDEDGFIRLQVMDPATVDGNWSLVKDERAASSSVEEFDENLRRNLSLLSTDPLVTYPSTNKVWDRFNKYFDQVIPLIFRQSVLKDYYHQALQEFWEDNIQYLELRGQLFDYKDDNNTGCSTEEGVEIYKNITEEFVRGHPDFIGAGVIMSGLRMQDTSVISGQVQSAVRLRNLFPDFFLGYDLVAQEDPFNSLLHYLDELLQPSQASVDEALPYFFHAGETNFQGAEPDRNLIDALLLNTTRIGHGYALAKHPELADLVKKRGIAVEVNPISNQLLGLVSDLRNHAMVPLLADDFPLVISSDDPATWEALPLTHDFLIAFLDMSGEHTGLAFLKQLAINSIKYSAMSPNKKERTMKLWSTKWDQFVEEVVAEFSLG